MVGRLLRMGSLGCKIFKMDGRLLHLRGENRDVNYWSESNQHVSGDSLPIGYISRYTETAHVSVRQNDLEELRS
ncbi:hypothetical protein GQ457_15G020080 [Hibiscus cannabinus]